MTDRLGNVRSQQRRAEPGRCKRLRRDTAHANVANADQPLPSQRSVATEGASRSVAKEGASPSHETRASKGRQREDSFKKRAEEASTKKRPHPETIELSDDVCVGPIGQSVAVYGIP